MRIAVVVFSFAVVATAPACARGLRHPTFAPQPTSALIEVDATPPPARVELVPDSPSPSAVWVDGEWSWRRGRWAWLRGRWVEAPPHASFSAWTYERGPDGRLWFAPGAWRDANGSPIDPPKVLAYASVESGAVVNADGTTELTGPTVVDRLEPSAVPASPRAPPED
jgi:hypothetical protein